jgi:hypothetical protein
VLDRTRLLIRTLRELREAGEDHTRFIESLPSATYLGPPSRASADDEQAVIVVLNPDAGRMLTPIVVLLAKSSGSINIPLTIRVPALRRHDELSELSVSYGEHSIGRIEGEEDTKRFLASSSIDLEGGVQRAIGVLSPAPNATPPLTLAVLLQTVLRGSSRNKDDHRR